MSIAAEETKDSSSTIHAVIQRVNHAELLLDNKDKWAQIDLGLVVSLGFSGSVEEPLTNSTDSPSIQAQVLKCVQSLLNLPLLTLGVWGDGSPPQTVLQLLGAKHEVGLMIIPQAALGASLKGTNQIRYASQLPVAEARKRYELFQNVLRREVLYATNPEAKRSVDLAALEARKALRANTGLDDFFKTGVWEGKFTQYDTEGLPTHTAEDKEVWS